MPALSYAIGKTTTPLLTTTIGRMLEAAAAERPGTDALVFPEQGVRLTYAELNTAVDDLARSLLALGVRRGDRVGILLPNCVEWLLVQFAVQRVGAIVLTINPAYRQAELRYVLADAGARTVISRHSSGSGHYGEMLSALRPELPDLHDVILIGEPDWDEFRGRGAVVTAADLTRAAAMAEFDDPAFIQYTSGTTGSPKGAVLSHRAVLNNGYFIGIGCGYTSDDRICAPVPLHHTFGTTLAGMAALAHRATLVLPGETFDPDRTLQAVDDERCTSLYGVPTMFIAQLNSPRFAEYDLSSLRTGIMAGSPCPVEIMKRAIAEMNMSEVTIVFGMTETQGTTQTGMDDGIAERVETVGRPMPWTEIRIAGLDDNRTVPLGEPGEICARGYSVAQGYWNDPARTSLVLEPSGWMHTGDLGTMDAEGYLRIVGRSKDVVIRGGENIYPREIEEFLYRHPAIDDVQVIGVPDDRYGEELMACVALHESAALTIGELREFADGQIARYKIPRYLYLAPEFPMTASGKVQKFRLRETAIRLIAANSPLITHADHNDSTTLK